MLDGQGIEVELSYRDVSRTCGDLQSTQNVLHQRRLLGEDPRAPQFQKRSFELCIGWPTSSQFVGEVINDVRLLLCCSGSEQRTRRQRVHRRNATRAGLTSDRRIEEVEVLDHPQPTKRQSRSQGS